MIEIKKLYCEPDLIEPIEFQKGVNLILGETSEASEKTNGVGKSLSIEFINFCLLKRFNESRVRKIPKESFPYSTMICLDFIINGKPITSKRSIQNQDQPILIIDGNITQYESVSDATQQLTNILYGTTGSDEHPSFRAVMAPLIRDERSEFKSLVKCHDTMLNIPANYTPHLYFLGINPVHYSDAKKIQSEIDNTTKAKSKIKRDVESLTGKSYKEADSDLNELNGQVAQIKSEVDTLENSKSFEIVRDEIVELESKLDVQRAKGGALKSELSKILLFKGDNYIDESEVEMLYNRFKNGLGELVKKELVEVTNFKKTIDNFQKSLLNNRAKKINEDLEETKKIILELDKAYKDKLTILDKEGVLRNLKVTISAYQKKLEEQSQLSAFIDKFEDYTNQIKSFKQERSGTITLLDSLITQSKANITALENKILEIHEYVMGNRRSSLKIKVTEKKEVVNYELRIHDDGSHSNEREKVFFYDLAILLTTELEPFHPGFLVHDNIFDVDQDTLLKSLDYLANSEIDLMTKQYILTLNIDKLHEDDLETIKLNIEGLKRASFTKSCRFLKTHYQEL
jgi:uncharacterized protein YydD (DUF2326 family)